MARTRAEFDAAIARSVTPEPTASPKSQARSARVLTLDRAERPSAGTLSPTLRGIIERAVVSATNTWVASDPDAGAATDITDIYEALSTIADAVCQVLVGRPGAVPQVPPTAQIREPIDRLRRALLDQGSHDSAAVRAEDVLIVVNALERVREASQRDAGGHFADQLSSGNALDLVVGIAHDMRSPLSSILFLVETLRKAYRGKSTSVEDRQLGLVYGAALGLSQLVSDVIELARGCDRLLDRKPVPFSVSEIINGVMRVVQPIAEEKRLEIYAELPEVDARVGYPAALSRVMLNLVTNALKFTNQGYVEISSRQLARTTVEFSVRDSGPGIAEEDLAVLYHALRPRHHTRGQVLSSSGLGLSICQRLVTAMGGELQVESQLGRETCFHFVLELPPAAKM